MAATYLNSSTFSAALDKVVNEFNVGATTNITVGDLLVAKGEVMHVRSIPVSGRVVVRRGYQGTRALAHANGSKFWIGSPEKFKAIKDNAAAIVGDSGVFPDFCLPGVRASDAMGNEYVMVDLTATCYSGTTVVISVDGEFTAAQAAGGTQGPVGVTVEAGTSDQWVWAQIYGYNAYAQETICASAGSSTYIAVPATTASTPSVGLAALDTPTTSAAYVIHGMFIVGAATSTVTSATSATGLAYPVFLNYPYTLNRTESIATSNS